MQPSGLVLLWAGLGLGLKLSLGLELGRRLGIEGPVLGQVGESHRKLGSAPAGPAGAFGGAHEVTPHLEPGRTDLTGDSEGPFTDFILKSLDRQIGIFEETLQCLFRETGVLYRYRFQFVYL